MKRHIFFAASFIFLTITLMVITSACKDQSGITDPFYSNDATSQTLRKMTDQSPTVNSFTPNYNEEEAMFFSGTLQKDIYPIRIGQKLNLVSRDLALVKDSSTATGTLVQKFDGELIIAGTFQKPTIGIHSTVDTVIHKPFSTTITRFIKYEKVSNTGNDTLDWKITAVSLPAGGTEGDDILIQKLTLTKQDGSSVVIDDPGSYFFNVGKDKEKVSDNDEDDNDNLGLNASVEWHGWKRLSTWFKMNQEVKMSLEVLSKSSDPDLLTITYGAMMKGGNRSKYKFDLVSTTQEGVYFRKTYERNLRIQPYGGRMHAVINALPRTTVYDTETTVEEKTWGIPYKVN